MFEKYPDTRLVAYAGEDPNTFLRENRVWSTWVPQVRIQGISGSNVLVQQILLSNGIHISEDLFWSESIGYEIQKMSREYIAYPKAFEFKSDDQVWISQLLHCHMMKVPSFELEYMKPTPEVRDYPFGSSALYWPKWVDMPKLREDLEKTGAIFDPNIIRKYIAIHWYRDNTKISTKKVTEAILKARNV